MNKTFTSGSPSLQKKRSKLTLWIRLAIFLGVVCFHLVCQASKKDFEGLSSHGRKLLSVNEVIFTEEPFGVVSNTTRLPNENITQQENCTPPAIDEFPSDGFNREQRKNGVILIHIIIACYCFWMLAAICDDYFVPAIEKMCFTFNMQEDVVGATFMAAATSSPELFINCIGTFVTKGDIGVGTIVGSAVFNILAVPACCGLFAGQVISLDWWPVSRDCLMYCAAVLGLIATLYDGYIMWYEALALVLAYFFYMFAMYCNDAMARKARKLVSKCRHKTKVRPFKEVTEISPLLNSSILKVEPGLSTCDKSTITTSLDTISDESDIELADSPWYRGDVSLFMFIFRWPITFLLWATIPDCRKHPRFRLLTFMLSIVWIALTSYLVAFLITIVGDTLNIPDSVMGLTILAAGMSVPEAVSSVIVTNQGHGAMGISNSIGSNTFDILLCLGLPWFIKAFFVPAVPGEKWVTLNSSGLTYSAVSLLTTLFGLYIAFVANKFRLDWKIGVACTVMYIGFLIISTMIELNFFFHVNLPVCDH